MKALKSPIIYLLFSLISYIGYGQRLIIELDLSSIPPGGIKIISENENVTYNTVRLVNKVPAKNYIVWFEKEILMFDALNPSDFSSDEINPSEDIDVCYELVTYLSEIETKSNITEIDIKNKIMPELEAHIKGCRNNIIKKSKDIENIEDADEKQNKIIELKKYESEINKIISATDTMFKTQFPLDIQIGNGEVGRIYVSTGESEWTFVIKGKQPGQWVTTYGFGFTSQKLESATYFTKQISDTTVFQILRARDSDILDLNYVPAVFFSYFPSQKFHSSWNHSLTAGLGFALSAPVVFLGYNGLFYNNIGLSAGIAFQQQNRLKSQYSENEILSITLDKGQLHDQVYRPNFFVSINFRFGENPFKSKNETDTE